MYRVSLPLTIASFMYLPFMVMNIAREKKVYKTGFQASLDLFLFFLPHELNHISLIHMVEVPLYLCVSSPYLPLSHSPIFAIWPLKIIFRVVFIFTGFFISRRRFSCFFFGVIYLTLFWAWCGVRLFCSMR